MTKRVLAVLLTLALILSNISGLGLVTNVYAEDEMPDASLLLVSGTSSLTVSEADNMGWYQTNLLRAMSLGAWENGWTIVISGFDFGYRLAYNNGETNDWDQSSYVMENGGTLIAKPNLRWGGADIIIQPNKAGTFSFDWAIYDTRTDEQKAEKSYDKMPDFPDSPAAPRGYTVEYEALNIKMVKPGWWGGFGNAVDAEALYNTLKKTDAILEVYTTTDGGCDVGIGTAIDGSYPSYRIGNPQPKGVSNGIYIVRFNNSDVLNMLANVDNDLNNGGRVNGTACFLTSGGYIIGLRVLTPEAGYVEPEEEWVVDESVTTINPIVTWGAVYDAETATLTHDGLLLWENLSIPAGKYDAVRIKYASMEFNGGGGNFRGEYKDGSEAFIDYIGSDRLTYMHPLDTTKDLVKLQTQTYNNTDGQVKLVIDAIEFRVNPNYVEPDPEVPDPVGHPENEEEIDITNGDSKGRQFPYSDTEAHIFPLKRALCVGEKVTVHISGTSDSDFRFWLCNDENGAISSDTKYASNDYGVTPGSFDFTFELEVKKVDIDIAAYIQFKGTAWDKPLDNFTITHLAVVYPELEPVEPPVCEEDHEGWTIVDVTDLAQKTGRFYVPFADGDEARVGDSVEFHFIGTANTEKETGAIRFYAVEGDGWDNNLSGAQANKASIFNGIFEFRGKIEEITNVDNGKNTTPESVAKGLMFDVTGDGYKDVTFTHFAYKIVPNAEYTLSAMTDCDGKSVGNITVSPAKDSYVSGDEITLTAPSVLGYDFLGWYKGVEQVCENLVYTFTITANTELVAKYKVNDTPAVVTIKVENGNACTANGTQITTEGKVSVKIGDTLTITAKDEDKKVLHWLNDSNKVLGSDNSLEITVTGSMTITLVYESEAEGGQSAFVQFVSDYGQVLYAKLVSNYSEIEVPYAPSKLGYKFNGWVLGNTKVEADSTAVNEKIAGGEKTITIKPTYTDNSSDFTVTLKYKLGDGIVEDRTVTKSYSIGKTLTLTAEPIEGYTFECWKNENGEVLGYSDSYVMQVTGNYTLIACYVEEGTTVEVKKPVINISELITVDEDDDIHKLSCVVTRNVPERYEVIEQGVLYGKNLGNSDFVYGDDGVKRYISNSLALNGVVRFNCKVTDLDLVVYFRGYMLLKDTETGNIEYYYSEIVYGSYNSIK